MPQPPTSEEVLDHILNVADYSWIPADVTFAVFRAAGEAWLRSDEGDVIKITVERLPRDQWPRPTA